MSAGELVREIANIRVSKSCTIRLTASGHYYRQNIESLVAQLQLGLDRGCFDDEYWEQAPTYTPPKEAESER